MAGSLAHRMAADDDSKPMPKKKSLFAEDSGTDDDQDDGGAALGPSSSADLKINEEYARRFEHNKKREERQRLEEKYKSEPGGGGGSGSESSDDELEDDAGLLMTEDLDAEISATLQAIKAKDPRIYDKSAVFYTPFDPEAAGAQDQAQKEKPVHLKDYHRERYLNGDVGADDDDDDGPPVVAPKTYVQEQQDIKRAILSEIDAAAATGGGEDGDDDDDEDWSGDEAFMKPKKQQQQSATEDGMHPSRAAAQLKLTESDIVNADKDPESFLNKFMASRAWAPEEGSRWEAFESDDGEDGDGIGNGNLAEEFEHAYNMRFEDPEKSNEVLKSYSRNLVAERSVRKEDLTGRKKQRLLEKERKEAAKKERDEDRRRLRKLKLEEAQDKLAKIKKAAGMSGKAVREEEWVQFLNGAWDDDEWEQEMRRKFGDEYYAEEDQMSAEEEADDDGVMAARTKKKKPKKPKWDDDIDVKDIIPDFDDESQKPDIALSDSEAEGQQGGGGGEEGGSLDEDEEDADERPAKKRKTSKDIKKDKAAAKRQARRELAQLEALVDTKMELENPRVLAAAGSSAASGSSSSRAGPPAFRYRETSPTSFGMTARDILLAPSDAALNEFAGLKKLATFRDAERKRRDKKRLGKKARLREWRREVFGRRYERTGPTFGFAAGTGAEDSRTEQQQEGNKAKHVDEDGDVVEGERKKKRKRSKGSKKKNKA